jgi:succinate-acetate transporter protein
LEARVFLQPVAAPVVLGSFALTSGLLIYGTWLAAAWGGPAEPKTFFPFILLFSGLGELGAAMWSYRARDAVSASIFGAWAAFWLGWGVMWILALGGTITIPARGTAFASMGQWFIYMAVISWTTAFAALATSAGGFLVQGTLGTGSALAAAGLLAPSPGLDHAGGWVLFAAGVAAFCVAAAQMIGPLGAEPVEYEHGDPGVKVGQ